MRRQTDGFLYFTIYHASAWICSDLLIFTAAAGHVRRRLDHQRMENAIAP